jgi:hypothetical protein
MGIKRQLFPRKDSGTVTAGSSLDLVTIDVPPKAVMRLKSFGNELSDIAAIGSVYWSFLVNGYKMPELQDLYDVETMREPMQELEISGGSQFIIRAVNGYGSDVKMGTSFEYEFIYPEQN